jgi:hypothetical protein
MYADLNANTHKRANPQYPQPIKKEGIYDTYDDMNANTAIPASTKIQDIHDIYIDIIAKS